jgi:hypothetical protein
MTTTSQVRPSGQAMSEQVKDFQKNQPFPLNSNCKIGKIKCVLLFLDNITFELFVVC